MNRLVISDNEGTTTVVPLVREEVSIGRKEGNTIRLTERNISRQHAQLTRVNGAFVIKDLNSYNGVLVNGQRVVGQSELREGDEITIGDYSILMEGEEAAAAEAPTLVEEKAPPVAEVSEDEPTRVAPIPQPEAPARLVVLGAPAAGAEMALPDGGTVRIGRAPEVEMTVDHRSVSREHAAIACDGGGQYRIIDRDSANGVLVNGEAVAEARLARGDVIELGEVLIRFVAPGEAYVFDPTEAELHARPAGVGGRNNALLAGGIVAAALVVAVIILSSGGDEDKPGIVTPEPAAPPAEATAAAEPVPEQQPPQQPAPAEEPAAAAPPAEDFASLLQSCRDAVAGGRFAEAMAHANAALRVQPEAPAATACLKTAQVNHNEEQTFVRGKAALESGDAEGAYREFSGLSPQSLFRVRPEVGAAVEAVGNGRVAEARTLVESDPRRAREIALSVVGIDGMPDALKKEARALAADAKAAAAEARAAARTKPRARKASKPSKGGMEVASACLARGDNACVVRALAGKARTAQELGLLIETYRAMGNSAQAQRNMRTYVQKYPSGKRADTYRRMLARQGL